ncbi:MAG: hypothetical protein EOP11_14435 [Proteobacteria bacterium]|nr:MAG: hypothetical protein EOP11_14435 [Pseudomonadota bacterium]
MKHLIGIFALLSLSACATVKVPTIKETHLAKQKAAQAHALAQLISPACPAPAYYKESNCGLENETLAADLKAFSEKNCEGLDAKACEGKFSEQAIPRWQARYPRANVTAIAEWCASHSADCHNLSLQELRWMDSHNQAVIAELDASLTSLKSETRLAYEKQRGIREGTTPKSKGSMVASQTVPAATQSAMADSQNIAAPTPPPAGFR